MKESFGILGTLAKAIDSGCGDFTLPVFGMHMLLLNKFILDLYKERWIYSFTFVYLQLVVP